MKALRCIFGLAVFVGTVASVAPVVQAVSYGGGNVQGYAADAPLDHGTIVQLADKAVKQVKTVGQSELGRMFGVVVDHNQLPVMISSEGLKNETFVAVSGTYSTLVSNQAGPIVAGDYVTLSSVSGVAMKAGTEEKTVFGRAAGAFDGKGITLGTTALKDTNGKANKTVTLGSIPVTIDIRENPNKKSTKVNVPPFLERIGLAPADKQVSPVRVFLSISIMVICILTAIVIVYSGVRNGVISIGRNPMSKKSIFRALIEVILTSLLILIIGLFAVYLLLKL